MCASFLILPQDEIGQGLVAAFTQVLAALRNCALGLLRQDGVTNLVARLRHHAWQPAHVVLSLLGVSLSGSLNHPG